MSEQDANKQFGNSGDADSQETKQSGDRGASCGSENISRPTDIQQSYGTEESNNESVSSNSAVDSETSEGANDVQQSYGGGDIASDRANQDAIDS